MTWLRHLLDEEGEGDPRGVPRGAQGRPLRGRGLRLHAEGRDQEPLGRLDPARLRLRRPHRRRPSLRRRQGQRQDRAAALPAALAATSSRSSPASASAAPRATGSGWCAPRRARNKIRAFLKRERREDAEKAGREELAEALRKRGLPPQRIGGSPLLVDVIREAGFRKADDFYVALGQGKISAKTVVNKVMQRLKQGEAVAGDETESRLAGVLEGRDERERRTQEATNYGIDGRGRRRRHGAAREVLPPGPRRRDRRLRLARPRDHDPPRGLQERRRPEEVAPTASPRSPGTATTAPPTGSRSQSMPMTGPACSKTYRGPSPKRA